jgi:uncharacterized protein with von Willebrand factor type A (vWA) domain
LRGFVALIPQPGFFKGLDMEHISEYLKQVNDLLNKHKKDEETHISATDTDQYQDDITLISESIGEQNEN